MTRFLTVRHLANYLLVVALASIFPGLTETGLRIVNQIAGLSIFLGCLAVMIVRLNEATYRLLHPMTWFLATSAAYYGWGSLIYYYATPETVAYSDVFYPVDDSLLWRINFLTLIGIAGVLHLYERIVCTGAGAKKNYIKPPSLTEASDSILYRTAIFFLITGLPTQLLLVMPADFSDSGDVIAGVWRQIGSLTLMALLPLLELARRNAPYGKLLFYSLLIFELLASLITLSKTEVLKVGIILILGWSLLGVKFWRLVLVGAIGSVFFSALLVPLVSYGRMAYNVRGVSSVTDVVALAEDLYTGYAFKEVVNINPEIQMWWSRMAYANAQGFAIEAYDKGQSGDTFSLALWTMVPRLIYPDKPITNTGGAFNELVNGNPDSKSAPGMFAEGYWNAGYIGLGVVILVLGVFIGYWEKFINMELFFCRYQQLPVMWMGLFPALQQESWFIPGTIGLIPFAIGTYWFFRLIFPGRNENINNKLVNKK